MILSFYDPIAYKAKTVSKNAPNILMTDIFRNYKKYFDKVALNYNLTTYYIQGAPRPETLANTIYNNPQMYWVLLFANNVYDPFHGWIKSQQEVYESIEQEYPDPETIIAYHTNIRGEKFYNLVEHPQNSGWWYDKGDINHLHIQYQGVLAPRNMYEEAILENEKFRKIRIVNPSDIESFIAEIIKELERNA